MKEMSTPECELEPGERVGGWQDSRVIADLRSCYAVWRGCMKITHMKTPIESNGIPLQWEGGRLMMPDGGAFTGNTVVTVCAWCVPERVQMQIEGFMADLNSHGICEACKQKAWLGNVNGLEV